MGTQLVKSSRFGDKENSNNLLLLHLSYENFNVKLFLLYKNKYMKVIFKPWCLHLYQVINDPCIKFIGLCMILVS